MDMPSLKRRYAAPSISSQGGQGQIQRLVEPRSPMTATSAIDGPSSPPQGTLIEETHSSHMSAALLNSKRHELLAQSDWLGLAIVRPLQLEFSSTVDKDRVGKRRKIHKLAQRSKPAVRRLLTPLFEEAPAPQGAAMRTTLPIDEMRIKVGTDAFESQTQRSRNSPKHTATSMRHPSVEFGPISEESMLLGDSYEDFQPRIPSGAAGDLLDESHLASHATTADLTQWHNDINARNELDDHTGMAQVDEWVAHLDSATRESSKLSLPPIEDDCAMKPFESSAFARTISQPSKDCPPTHIGGLGDSAFCKKSGSGSSGALMRQLLGIQKFTSSNASVSAVRSSSQHSLTSELSHRPILDIQVSVLGESANSVSTPCGVGTQDPDYTWHESRERAEESSAAQSPSDWHSGHYVAQVPGQAHLAEAADMKGSEDRHNDCWRDFIIGSIDGSSQSSDQPRQLEDDELDGLQHVNEVFATSSLPVSGMGSSDMAIGGSSITAKRDTSDRDLGREEGSQWNAHDDAPLSPPRLAYTPNFRITNEDVRRTSHNDWPIDKSRYLPNIQIASHKQKTPIKPAKLANESAAEAHVQKQRAAGLQAKAVVHAGERDVYDLPCSSDTG
ncbi:hypothetical protein KC343_g8689 [Hortaea werneckii]|nr:hypothetical protein KC352_g12031 [Hortaea werneckii]KAI7561550.1 hypothetical protein KC317_g9000 [Hortaea werneckii]KAI7613975.1 hypothetical protein KC346_g7132 [Hortaea werneckii]KAI7619527.1 hypothetical protein KC343_g8689 [Hortaea werneckii]KAI7656947.1 hypothetical protein KC319_g9632 [Hortaea werneckii]